jgi:hypothetical protein
LEWAVVAIHPDAEQVIDMDADMQGDQGAEQLKAELDKGLDMAKKQLAEAPPLAKGTAGADALELAKALVAAISVERNAKHVDVTLKRVPELAKAPEIVGRAIQEAQSAARRMMVQSNGRNLSMALLIGEQVTSKRPTNIVDAAGKPLLSWRVQILPYIEQGHIFNKLNPKEAWDSAQNRELHGQMPELLKSDAASEPNTTAWRMLPANSMGMELIEVGKGAAVSWMEPDELKIDPANPLAALGEAPPDGFIVAFKDGHMERVPAEKLKAALEKK